jgi:uncharacterized membrane protein YdjX (TVP38/TMEM64 family)
LKWTTVGKILIISLIILGLVWFNHTYLNIQPQSIREWIISFGVLAPLVYIALYTLRPLLLFPASILSLAAGLAFGPIWGTLYTIIGATGGAVLSFFVARKLGGRLISSKWKGKGEVIQTQLEQNGFYYVLLLRLIPIFNFDMISYVSGVSKVRFQSFFLGTIIGIIPGTFAYNFLGSSLFSASWLVLATAITLFAIITVIPILSSSSLRAKFGLGKNGGKKNA